MKLYFCISKLFRKCKCLGNRNALRISFLLMWAKFVKRFILLVSYITWRCIILAPQAKKFTSSACIVCQRECVTLKIEKIYFFVLKNSSVQNYTEFANVCKNDYCLLQVQNVVLRHIKSQMQILKLISK